MHILFFFWTCNNCVRTPSTQTSFTKCSLYCHHHHKSSVTSIILSAYVLPHIWIRNAGWVWKPPPGLQELTHMPQELLLAFFFSKYSRTATCISLCKVWYRTSWDQLLLPPLAVGLEVRGNQRDSAEQLQDATSPVFTQTGGWSQNRMQPPCGLWPCSSSYFQPHKENSKLTRAESWWIALQLSVKSVTVELKLFHITYLCPPAWPDLFAFFCSSCPNFPYSLPKMPNKSPPSTVQDFSSTVALMHELKYPELLVLFLCPSLSQMLARSTPLPLFCFDLCWVMESSESAAQLIPQESSRYL